MTISAEQFAAARALLRLDQKEISKIVNITQPKLSKFEKGRAGLSVKNLERLNLFFDERGIEFLDFDGIRRKPHGSSRSLFGYEGFKEFINDVYNTVKDGGDVCVTNVDERQFEKWQSVNADSYLKSMAAIENLRFRAILKEGDEYFTASYAEYRYLSASYFTGVPTYLYGDKRAEILFDENEVTVFLTNNARLVEAQRKVFDILWSASAPI